MWLFGNSKKLEGSEPSGEPEVLESSEQDEKVGEQVEIKINTMADFLKSLKWSYDLTEDENAKKQIAHQIVKIEMGLNGTGYSAEDVKVEDTSDGVLGLYSPGSGKTAISKDLLEDFETSQQLIKHVLVHERNHKEGIYDEGLAERKASKRLSDGLSFYVGEQQRAKSAFYREGIDKALELYDLDNPDELFEYYLQVELEKNFKGQDSKLRKIKENEKSREIIVDQQEEKIRKGFKKGADELFDKLKQRNYSIKKRTREILLELAK